MIPHTIPLGILYLASSLRKEVRHSVRIIDARCDRLSYAEISRWIRDFNPEVVGITGLSIEANEIHNLAGLVKVINPACKLVVGGAYATFTPEAVISDLNIDYVVIGEGERTICALLDALENDDDVAGISGLAFRNKYRMVINPPNNWIDDINSIAFPAFDLLDIEKYFKQSVRHSENPLPRSNRILPLFTSRGCPYHCIYCRNVFGRHVRLRSVTNVMQEIEQLTKQFRADEIEIIDDIFNYDIPRAKAICEEIYNRGIKVHLSFPNALRVDMMDEELLVKLKKAGTYMIVYGIESGSPGVQRLIKKNLDLHQAQRIINHTIQQGILTGGYFMLGFPGESKYQMRDTIRFAKKSGIHLMGLVYVTPLPGTELFNQISKKNSGPMLTLDYNYQKLSLNTSAVSDRELKNMRKKGHREFYLRPLHMLRIWKMLPHKKHIVRNFIAIMKRCFIDSF